MWRQVSLSLSLRLKGLLLYTGAVCVVLCRLVH